MFNIAQTDRAASDYNGMQQSPMRIRESCQSLGLKAPLKAFDPKLNLRRLILVTTLP